jgi:hypothetical protein
MVVFGKGFGEGRLMNLYLSYFVACYVSSLSIFWYLLAFAVVRFRVIVYCRNQQEVHKRILIAGLGANTVCQAECIMPITDQWSCVRPWPDFVTELFTYSYSASWQLQCFRICRTPTWKGYHSVCIFAMKIIGFSNFDTMITSAASYSFLFLRLCKKKGL